MWHPDEGTIHAWLDGALPDDERAEVERHVAVCADCSAIVAEARGLIAGASRIVGALDVVPGGVIPKPAAAPAPVQSISLWRALRITPARAAIAASLIVAASVVLAKRHDTPDKMVPHAPVAPIVAVAEPAPDPRPVPPPVVRTESPAPAPARTAAVLPSVMAAEADAPATAPAAQLATTLDTTTRRDSIPVVASSMAARMGQMPDAGPQAKAQLGFSTNRVLGLAANSTEASSNAFVGCYQVTVDSMRRPEFVPTRFALQLAPRNEPSAQNVVRAVAPDGRVDSILAGSSWRATTPMLANVSFASLAGPQRLNLLAGTNGSLAAYVVNDAERRSVPISRSRCVPEP